MTLFLVDNGSLRAASTLNLRAVAAASSTPERRLEPVSLLHASAVPAAELGGVPAEILEPAIVRRATAGERRFGIIPFFVGPSRALTAYIPERAASLAQRFPGIDIRMARPLADLEDPSDPGAATLATMLADRVRAAAADSTSLHVALVDHGSPEPRVTAVRDHLAVLLRKRLGNAAANVAACSMERRDGPDYAFNEPLLERLLDTPPFTTGRVIVAMLFLSPGRHAGPDGDVAGICRAAEERHPGLSTTLTGLLGDHPAMPGLVARRAAELLG